MTVALLVMLVFRFPAIAASQDAPSTQPESAPATRPAVDDGCYVGPLDLRVLNPDGSPAAGVPVGVFGGWWCRKTPDVPITWGSRIQTDANGQVHRGREKECCFPTFYYAFDESRQLAGFAMIEDREELAKKQTLRLQPARWVRGMIDSPDFPPGIGAPEVACASISPILDQRLRSRTLRYASKPGEPFAFLLPPGEYRLDAQVAYCSTRWNVVVRVPAEGGDVQLAPIHVEPWKLLRMIGEPAPEWDVDSWIDGKSRSLSHFRGRPIVICFWHSSAGGPQGFSDLFSEFRKAKAAGAEFVAIHAPIDGGLSAAEKLIEQWRPAINEPSCSSNIREWPFPVALDKGEPFDLIDRPDSGQSRVRYGKGVWMPLLVLVDGAGRVVASNQTPKPEFDEALSGNSAAKP